MKQSFLLPLDGDIVEIKPENGTDFKLAELYNHLDCDMIQVLPAPAYHDVPMILIIDEEGKFKTDETGDIPVNYSATVLVKSFLFRGDFIAGRAIYCPSEMLK